MRAITLPVVGPLDAKWEDLRVYLKRSFSTATRCANWMMTTLYVRDLRREPEDKKLKKMPRQYLYPEAKKLFPELATQTLSTLEQQIQRIYRAQRYEILWMGSRSLATFRYPFPVPLPWQMCEVEKTEGGLWLLSVRLGDLRWKLKLRGGHMMHR